MKKIKKYCIYIKNLVQFEYRKVYKGEEIW